MKTGLTTSLVFHGLLIGFGLFSLSAPPAFDVADVESLPVDIVSESEFTEIIRGDRKATAAETPAPEPTKRTDPVEAAENVGDNKADLETPPTPEPRPEPVKTAATPEPVPTPEPAPETDEIKTAKVDPAPVPATEVKPEPTPKVEVKPEPAEETAVTEKPDAETVKLPEIAPIPEARPEPPEATTAKAPERKDAEKPAINAKAKPRADDSEFNADEIAALLNREKASGGGAKRSNRDAALGGSKDTEARKLSQGEMDALRSQLESCWALPIGMEGSSEFRASIQFKVDPSGKLEGRPTVSKSSGNRQFDESAVRAVQKCDRAGLALPAGKQAVWADIIVNFDPSEMF